MHILNTSQIRGWDEYTIRHEPISSLNLMERAAKACFEWLMAHYPDSAYTIFCGKGNNGGDGLAIARMLANARRAVTVHILEFGHMGTDDFQANLARLHATTVEIVFISAPEAIKPAPAGNIFIDALLGSGLNRPIEGLTADLVRFINASPNKTIAIDIPSGLFADSASGDNICIEADHTLSFQCYKTAFLFAENYRATGHVHILNIGLDPTYLKTVKAAYHLTDKSTVASILPPRKEFTHKGTYGSGGMIAGSKGMMGAAILSAKAFMRAGGGKLTCHIPEAGYTVLQTALPEVMCLVEEGADYIRNISPLEKYDTLAIGPGWGSHKEHASLLEKIFDTFRKPVVIDADALNILSKNKELMRRIPPGSITTPHPKEFERLFGAADNDFQKIDMALENAARLQIIIILKGYYSFTALPDGSGFFNDTGNPGMATAGTGDVLTGLLAGLLAQKIPPARAAIAGVYLHGLAGNFAAAEKSQEAMLASDVIESLGRAFLDIREHDTTA